MKTVTLEVATLQEVKRRAQAAFTGRKQGARIVVPRHRTLSPGVARVIAKVAGWLDP
jgi:hypothetical protein